MKILRQCRLVLIVYSGFLAAILAPSIAASAEPQKATNSNGTSSNTLPAAMLAPALLADSGAIIGKVSISNGNIFDIDSPEEDKFLFRLANKAHVVTRPAVIEQQLLFSEGEPFSVQAIEESERIVRSNRYIQDVSIKPVHYENGVVDVDVSTSDTWTLMPKLSLSRSGGKNQSAFGIKEMNLLGSGVALEALFKSDVDRDSRILKVVDRNLGDSWYGLTAVYADNSDGFTRLFELGKPFYSLDSTASNGISWFDNDQVESLYDHGKIAADYRHEETHQEIFYGWSKGLQNGWTKRYITGFVFDEHTFSPNADSSLPVSVVPGNRKLAYPFIGIELLEDDFEKTSNIDQINRTEDIYLGTRLSARLGMASSATGSDRDAWIFGAAAGTGFGSTANNALLLDTELGSRWEQGRAANLLFSARATYFKRQSEHRLLYAVLDASYGENLDQDQFLELGGDNGLRGYPLRYQLGDKRALLTVEQRFFTDWYPFRLFHVGGAVFFDVGRAWGESPIGRADSALLKDVGIGLRLGNTRSGLGRMTHIDLAVPLDGSGDIKNVQFVVSTKKSF